MADQPTIVALIPARSGSKRLPGKNIARLAGHPLLAYSIAAARQSGIFGEVIVSTDSEHYADIARHYDATVPFLRPEQFASDQSPDIEWVSYTLNRLKSESREYDCFSILRPTSPFRLPGTIRRAWSEFLSRSGIDSLRGVELCKQHPGKMWVIRNRRMVPLLPLQPAQPWHSSQHHALPEVYVQNASLEIAWTRLPMEQGSIAGDVLYPFLTEGYEGFDINRPYDIKFAQELAATGEAQLPAVDKPPFPEDGE
jgi:CMP-N,N'-diacetyllegionaminic acid synthase